MAINKKKKKKEEFDASLMGGYLPGARSPVSALMSRPMPVAALPKLYQMPSFLQSNFRYLGDDVRAPDPEPPLTRKILSAWWQYTGIPSALGGGAGALASQAAFQAPQAKYASPFMHLGFKTAWLLEASLGTAAVAAFFTIMDPDRLWRAPYRGTLDYGNPDFGKKRTTPWAEGTGFQG